MLRVIYGCHWHSSICSTLRIIRFQKRWLFSRHNECTAINCMQRCQLSKLAKTSSSTIWLMMRTNLSYALVKWTRIFVCCVHNRTIHCMRMETVTLQADRNVPRKIRATNELENTDERMHFIEKFNLRCELGCVHSRKPDRVKRHIEKGVTP